MSDQATDYQSTVKKAWIIYAFLAIVVTAFLVLVIASDAEEMFFFGIMPLAAAYVLRPTEKYMDKMILKFTGKSRPAE